VSVSDYPQIPHPKEAVQRMENKTKAIIQMSSFFIKAPPFKNLFDQNADFRIGPPDLYLTRKINVIFTQKKKFNRYMQDLEKS
jgi:hypothetical protein